MAKFSDILGPGVIIFTETWLRNDEFIDTCIARYTVHTLLIYQINSGGGILCLETSTNQKYIFVRLLTLNPLIAIILSYPCLSHGRFVVMHIISRDLNSIRVSDLETSSVIRLYLLQ